MIKKIILLALCSMLLAPCVSSDAQQPVKVSRIGVILDGPGSVIAHYQKAFLQRMRDLGWVEGQNIAVEYRLVEGTYDRVPELVAELLSLKVEVIVTSTGQVTRRAKNVTTTTPIIFVHVADPVGTGLVASLARPGGNVTGLTDITAELFGKRLELLKEIVPKVSRMAVLYHGDAGSTPGILKHKDTEVAAQSLGVKLQFLEVRGANPDIEGAFRTAASERSGALVTSPDPLISFHQKRILQLAEQNHLPAMHPSAAWTDSGGLMSYGVNRSNLYQRAAVFVDKILKGTKPTDLPVEQPTKFEFTINLKTAKQIGLTIPQSVLSG
jgi:putative tryptophan/tyrosine transport system substrate-binding protein